eukprot:3861727-Prymnesium_polylepis.1
MWPYRMVPKREHLQVVGVGDERTRLLQLALVQTHALDLGLGFLWGHEGRVPWGVGRDGTSGPHEGCGGFGVAAQGGRGRQPSGLQGGALHVRWDGAAGRHERDVRHRHAVRARAQRAAARLRGSTAAARMGWGWGWGWGSGGRSGGRAGGGRARTGVPFAPHSLRWLSAMRQRRLLTMFLPTVSVPNSATKSRTNSMREKSPDVKGESWRASSVGFSLRLYEAMNARTCNARLASTHEHQCAKQ